MSFVLSRSDPLSSEPFYHFDSDGGNGLTDGVHDDETEWTRVTKHRSPTTLLRADTRPGSDVLSDLPKSEGLHNPPRSCDLSVYSYYLQDTQSVGPIHLDPKPRPKQIGVSKQNDGECRQEPPWVVGRTVDSH